MVSAVASCFLRLQHEFAVAHYHTIMHPTAYATTVPRFRTPQSARQSKDPLVFSASASEHGGKPPPAVLSALSQSICYCRLRLCIYLSSTAAYRALHAEVIMARQENGARGHQLSLGVWAYFLINICSRTSRCQPRSATSNLTDWLT